jgi:CheY-like chemotaxis protein
MVLIATKDLELARLVLEALSGEKELLVRQPTKDEDEREDEEERKRRAAMRPVERDGYDGAKRLRHWIHAKQPAVLLLDARFGGQLYRALEAVPRLLEESRENLRVILLIPFDSKAAKEEAARLGCFDVLNYHPRRRRKVFQREVLSAVEAAEIDRAAVAPSQRARVVFH